MFHGEGPWDFTITGPDMIIDITDQSDSLFVIHDPESGTYQVTALTTETCPNDAGNNGPPLTVTIVPEPTIASASATDTVCADGGIATLSGNNPDTGTGVWSILSGPDMSIAQIDDPTGTITTFDPAQAGQYVIAWTITNGPCAPSEDGVTIMAVDPPSAADAGADGSICLGETFALQAVMPTMGTGRWTIISGTSLDTSQIATSVLPNAAFTPTTPGSYALQWTVSNPPCAAVSDAVSISVMDPGTGPVILGLDDAVACDGEYQTLMIADPVPGLTYSWSCPQWTPTSAQGTTVTVQWTHPGTPDITLPDTITVTLDGDCGSATMVPVQISPSPASCPKGIVYFEPYGLAILDETANFFQWGTMDDSLHFVAVAGMDDQTTFIPGLTNCDSSGYAVRTSIDGAQCWSTTLSCATPEMLARDCDNGMAIEDAHVRAYPNPSGGGPVTLEAIGQIGQPLNIDVSDLNGRVLSRGTIRMSGASTMTLDLYRLDHGIYVLRAWNVDMDQTIKLVID
jgi:hypothetical protein